MAFRSTALTIFVAAGLGLGAVPAAAQSGCEGADDLARAHLATDAVAQYELGSGCAGAAAATSQADQAAELVAVAKRDEDANRFAAARDGYAGAAALDAGSATAVDGLVRVVRLGTGGGCGDAEALERARQLERAVAGFAACGDEEGAERVRTARDEARARYEAGEVDDAGKRFVDARTAYADAVAIDASLSDAKERLRALATQSGVRPCASAEALAEAKLLAQAEQAYKDLQASSESPPCAVAGLTTVQEARKKAAETAEKARASEVKDELAAARDGFASAAAADASLEEARDGLQRVAGAETPLPDRGRDLVDDLMPWLGLAAAAGILLALLGAVVLRLSTRWWNRRVWKSFDDAQRVLWPRWRRALNSLRRFVLVPVRWALRVGVTIEDFDGEEGTTVKGALQAAIPRAAGSGRRNVDVVSTPLSSASAFSEFSDAIEKLPQGKIWAALIRTISRLFPRETLKLTGTVRTGERRKGLSLVLSRADSTAIDSVTIWASDFQPDLAAAPEAELTPRQKEQAESAIALAGAAWTAFAYLEYVGVLTDDEWRAQLGTRSWRSYALCMAGAFENEDDRRYSLFAKARDADGDNLLALVNLGFSALRLKRYGIAKELARRVRDELEADRRGLRAGDTTPVRAGYLEGVTALHRSCEEDFRTKPLVGLEAARRHVAEDLGRLDAALERLRRPSVRRYRAAFATASELDAIRGPMVVLAASLDVVTGHEVGSDLDGLTLHAEVSARTHYNLACFHSLRGAAGAESSGGASPQRAATRHLERCTHVFELQAWAEEDPTLRWLRKKHPAAWRKATAPLVPAPPAPKGLAAIECIGDHAAALATNGITKEVDLVARTTHPRDRVDVAGLVEVSPLLVERWSRACEVQVRMGLTPARVNQLDAAQVASIGALRLQTPEALVALVKAANDGVDDLTDEMAATWIAQAKARAETVKPPLLF